ncbi:T9SS type A sorting domain-containing protein [bacterium]|jgi:hypothetical protein|nr:T9SS type A sorting domain-containing protein [bacterium]
MKQVRLWILGLMLAAIVVQPAYATVAAGSVFATSSDNSGGATFENNTYQSSQVVASSENNAIDVLGLWFINNGQSVSDDLVVFRLIFNNFLFGADGAVNVSDIDLFNDGEARFVTPPLVYPNPWVISKSATAELGYTLSRNMKMTLHIYDMLGHRIYQREIEEGSVGGAEGTGNKIKLNAETFGGYELSSGVYFYVFVYEGKVIEKGKFAVLP